MPKFDIGPAGGSGGDPFRDEFDPGYRLYAVTVRHGEWIDSIQVKITDSVTPLTLPRRGGTGGSQTTFGLDPDEHITLIDGMTDNYVFQINFHTDKGNVFSYGQGGKDSFSLPVPAGYRLCGLFGRSHTYLDKIGITVEPSR
ncbi:MAG: jacalin-like lectin [Thermoanaerobaculia bacterium]